MAHHASRLGATWHFTRPPLVQRDTYSKVSHSTRLGVAWYFTTAPLVQHDTSCHPPWCNIALHATPAWYNMALHATPAWYNMTLHASPFGTILHFISP